jgi:16S rRNA (guanine(966)-N(2))-methyltransferase RsmD
MISTIKIIAGEFKGKKLLMVDGNNTRSSKAILKESLFNTLQFDVYDSIWVEAFAGTGSIGLEAISRGASQSYFLEKDREAFKILQKNIKSINEDKCKEYLGDSFENIWLVIDELQRNKQKAFFYFDPPFSIREGNEEIYDMIINTISRLPQINVEKIIIEYQTGIVWPKKIGNFNLTKNKKFGKSSLAYYE